MNELPNHCDTQPVEPILSEREPFYATSPAYRSLAGRDRADSWSGLGVRIALAGGLYPIVLSVAWGVPICLMTVFHLIALDTGFHRWADVAGVLLGSIVGGPFLFGFAFIYTAILTTGVLAAVGGTLRLLGEAPPRDMVGAFCGTMVAFVATLPVWLSMAAIVPSSDWFGAVLVWLHLTVALAMGQVAGLLAAIPEVRRRRRGRLRVAPFRLTLWRLMAAMIPLSLMLSLLRATGLLTGAMAVSSLAGLATGWLLRVPISRGVNWWLDRHLRLRRSARVAATRST